MSNLHDHLKKVGGTITQNLGGEGIREAVLVATPADDSESRRQRARGFWLIPVDEIEPSQPRLEFDEESLSLLAQDIAKRGLLQPIRVRKGPQKYMILAGERRWRASKMAPRVKEIPCQVVEQAMTEGDILEEQLVENIHREGLQEIEKAKAYRTLLARNNWTQAGLAQALSLSMASVSRTLKLLELDGQVQQYVADGKLPASAGYALSRVADPAEQRRLAEKAVAEGISRDDLAANVQDQAGRRRHKATRTGARLVCRLADGCSVTLADSEGLTPDRVIDALQRVLNQARKLKAKNLSIDQLPALLKSAGGEKSVAREPGEPGK
jgi:ParB family transcriptional regulator, chromosome partitioning protein